MQNMIRSLWSTRVFAIYPTIESLASSYTVNDDLRRETDTGYREVVPGDKTRRSIARVSLFRDRFWRSSKEREDNVVRSDFFRGENVIRGYLVARDTTKWFRYLANEGERNKFRATRRPASVIGWRCTKIIPEIWMWLLNVLAQVKLRFNFATKFIIDRIKLLVRMPRSKI